MKCKWCDIETDKPKFDHYCSPQCELAYRSTIVGNTKSILNDSRYGRRLCIHCKREYVGYLKHGGFCTKAHKKEHTSSTSTHAGSRYKLLQRDKFRCIYCGASPITDETIALRIDHIYPESLGGKSIAGNLVTACYRCNAEKYNAPIDPETYTEIQAEVLRRNMQIDWPQTKSIPMGEKYYKNPPKPTTIL